MKKIIITFLFLFFTLFNFLNINAQATPYIISGANDSTVKKIDDFGNQIWSYNFGQTVTSVVLDDLENIYAGGNNSEIRKLDSNGNLQWTFTGHTGNVNSLGYNNNFIYSGSADNTFRKIDLNGNQIWSITTVGDIRSINFDSNGNIIVGSFNHNIYKLDSNGNILWTFTNHTGSVLDLYVDINDNIYSASSDTTARKIDNNGNQIWVYSGYGSIVRAVNLDSNLNVYIAGNSPFTIDKLDNSGNFISSFSGHTSNVNVIKIDGGDNIYSGASDSTIRKWNTSGNQIWSNTNHTAAVRDLALIFTFIQEPDFYEVNLTSNYPILGNFIYFDDNNFSPAGIINTLIANDETWGITTSAIDISPFTFNFWFDLDENQIFTTNRTFTILDPDRDYNLVANYSLNNAINLELNSNLPSPPNFEVIVDTIENVSGTLIDYPFNKSIPQDYNFIIEAPINNVGFYEFDYWYDNINENIFTTSAIVPLKAIEDYDLTAIYTLPNEYRIDLIIESVVGVITFQHGILDPITGTSISVTIGQGDSWSATAPLNENYLFLNWLDLYENDVFSSSRNFIINNTTKNYYLSASYVELVTVNWDSQGGTLIPSQKIIIGSQINKPNDPLRPNFAFEGWALPSDPNNPLIFPRTVNENTTFQAIWLPTYTLTFNSNGGSSIPIQTIIENDLPTLVTPSRFGYTFEGWFTDNITFNSAFNFNQPFTQNTIVHAKWEFGTAKDAEVSLNSFFTDAGLDNPIAQWIIVLALFIFINVIIFIYKGPFIVTIILNFILTALFIVLGFIPIWITIIIFMALFGFGILMFTGGRS